MVCLARDFATRKRARRIRRVHRARFQILFVNQRRISRARRRTQARPVAEWQLLRPREYRAFLARRRKSDRGFALVFRARQLLARRQRHAVFVFDLPAPFEINPWKVRRHPAFGIAPNLANGFRLSEGSIVFDTRHELENWTSLDFDDSSWPQPEKIESVTELVERPIPLWQDYGVRQYSHVERATGENGAQIWTAALPYTCQFAPTLRVFDEIGGRTIAMHTDNPKEVLSGGSMRGVRSRVVRRV